MEVSCNFHFFSFRTILSHHRISFRNFSTPALFPLLICTNVMILLSGIIQYKNGRLTFRTQICMKNNLCNYTNNTRTTHVSASLNFTYAQEALIEEIPYRESLITFFMTKRYYRIRKNVAYTCTAIMYNIESSKS